MTSSSKTTSKKTLLKYIKPTKFQNCMFLIEELAPEDIGRLKIKEYKDREWAFIRDTKIKPKLSFLIPKRVYELEIKERKWNDKIVRTYHLHNTLDTLNYHKNNNKKPVECLFS